MDLRMYKEIGFKIGKGEREREKERKRSAEADIRNRVSGTKKQWVSGTILG